MSRKLFIALFLIVAASLSVTAQIGFSNHEFIENKGQWDPRVNFKAGFGTGNFYIQQAGFTVLMRNASDLHRIHEFSHGGGLTSSPVQTASVKKTIKNTTSSSSSSALILHSHVYEVSFLGANDHVVLVPDKALPGFTNYFIGNDPAKWGAHCKTFQAITYQNIYPNIDVRYYTSEGQLKYDFIIHPGGDPGRIAMKYTGPDKLVIRNNELIIKTSVGDAHEGEPHTYQQTKTGRSALDCQYLLDKNNTVRFSIKNYDPAATLVIDPSLTFSTFTGSTSDNWGYTATYDAGGNFYSGSIVLDDGGDSGNGFPVSTGAFQTSFQGGDDSEGGGFKYDVGIMKFNSTGTTRLYATYLGGGGDEQPHSLIADNAGNLVIAGRTSSPDFPTVPNGAGGTYGSGGGFDIFITKLNADGSALIGSKKIGGSGSDGVNIQPKYVPPGGTISLRLNYGDDGRSEVILDGANNIYVASSTQSMNIGNGKDYPVTANAFQKLPGGGKQDGVVIKTDASVGNVLFSSFIGGNADDAAFVLALNPLNNNIYVGGGTASPNLPGTGSGPVISSTLQGSIDGFVSIISNDGSTLFKTSYFGVNPGVQVIYGIEFDAKGFPYIMGTTTGKWPVINAAFSQANGKQFIGKLKPDLSAYQYSTVFGKGDRYPDISPTAFLVDKCENVYVAGWGGGVDIDDKYSNSGTNGLSVTAGALKATTDGEDFYFFVLQKNAATQLYGSFFGQQNGAFGDHVDGGTSRFDKQGIIYEAICANCYGGAVFPTTANAWSPTNKTGTNGCNLAAVKIAFNFAGVSAGVKSGITGRYITKGCIPMDVILQDTIRNAKIYRWNFGDGSPDSVTTAYEVLHTYNSVGNFRVRLIAIDSNSCNVSDTTFIDLQARNDPGSLGFNSTKLLPCNSLSYRFDNISTPPAGKPFQSNSFTWDYGDGSPLVPAGTAPVTHSYASSGTYIVKLILTDTNYCNAPDTLSVPVKIFAVVKAQIETPLTGCAPYTAFFNNTSVAGQQFYWDFGDGTQSTDLNPTHLYSGTGSFTITLIAVDSATCNISDTTQITITIDPRPQAVFDTSPVPPIVNTPTVFTNSSIDATHYKWIFGDGDTALKASLDTVMHQYQKTGQFQACLVAFNDFGCTDTVCHPVDAIVNPLMDVPTAFTPGRFGQNGVIRVKSFGISSMIFRIYNRWGQVVFESNDPNYGWDGTYKGVPQPMDVYVYIVDAQFFDGTKGQKKGDITLLR